MLFIFALALVSCLILFCLVALLFVVALPYSVLCGMPCVSAVLSLVAELNRA